MKPLERLGRNRTVSTVSGAGGGFKVVGGWRTSSTKELAASKRSPRMPFGDIMEAVIIRGVVRRSEIARNVLGTMSKMSIIRGSLYLRILKHFGIDTSTCSPIRSNFILRLLSPPPRLESLRWREFEAKSRKDSWE